MKQKLFSALIVLTLSTLISGAGAGDLKNTGIKLWPSSLFYTDYDEGDFYGDEECTIVEHDWQVQPEGIFLDHDKNFHVSLETMDIGGTSNYGFFYEQDISFTDEDLVYDSRGGWIVVTVDWSGITDPIPADEIFSHAGFDVEACGQIFLNKEDNKDGYTRTQNAIISTLDDVEEYIAAGDIVTATGMLQELRGRLDGCGDAADKNDYVVNCEAQVQFREYVDLLIANLTA
jgi:hypothetical protein